MTSKVRKEVKSKSTFVGFFHGLKEQVLHIQWNSIMDGIGLEPLDIYELPSFKKNKMEQVRLIQLERQQSLQKEETQN